MCAIIGAMFSNVQTDRQILQINIRLNMLIEKSKERGRDGFGYAVFSENMGEYIRKYMQGEIVDKEIVKFGTRGKVLFVCNLRAEPTTEYIKDKSENDQQPYSLKDWCIVHNGTIANDADLRNRFKLANIGESVETKIDSSAIVETLVLNKADDTFSTFQDSIRKIIGSYAIIAVNNKELDTLYLACNYRPIWAYQDSTGVYFASSEKYFTVNHNGFNKPFLLDPYSCYVVKNNDDEIIIDSHTLQHTNNKKALVVCSGGMDSVVAACYAQKECNYEITLIHFLYGSRAEGPEVKAVKEISDSLNCPLILFNLPIYDKTDSPLLQDISDIADGVNGAEFAHEWVPARNLVMLSVATAYAEAKGFSKIILGNNLEEAGAYPDNEPEFINRLNSTLKYSVADGKQVSIEMPVGNLMKHEIVKLGIQLKAPLHLTWSCYNNGEIHCGHCGPCFMRKTAFLINREQEVIKYEVH